MQNFSRFLKEQKLKREEEYCGHPNIQEIFQRLKKKAVKQQRANIVLSEKQFIVVCRAVRNITLGQPSLLRLNGPMIVATGTVGYYNQLCNIFQKCGNVDLFNYLFLGDYTGKGPSSIECLMLLFCSKIKLQYNFFLLRGCYQSITFARGYNLYQECAERFSPKAWAQACQALCSLPFAAIIDNQVFCVHGGIGPTLKSLDEINKLPRPLDTPQVGMPCDLIWSDPSSKQDSHLWSKNQRGFGFTFHHNVIDTFLKENRLAFLVRGHQIAYDGVQLNTSKNCGTITSHSNYCGLFNNAAAVMVLDYYANLYFKIIKQRRFFQVEYDVEQSPQQYLQRISREKRELREKRQEQRIQKKIQRQKQLILQKQLQKIKEAEYILNYQEYQRKQFALKHANQKSKQGNLKEIQVQQKPIVVESSSSDDVDDEISENNLKDYGPELDALDQIAYNQRQQEEDQDDQNQL